MMSKILNISGAPPAIKKEGDDENIKSAFYLPEISGYFLEF